MPQIENVTQIKRGLKSEGCHKEGIRMGLNMKERQAVTREYRPRYQKAKKKEKKALLDEFATLTGYHRKHAVRLLGARQVKQVVLYLDGKAVKLKPDKKRPANRKGKRIYDEATIACLRRVWAFFWYKCGKILAPLMRQQMLHIQQWQAFGITAETAEMLARISPATIDRYLKKDRNALALKGKSLTKPLDPLKSRIPIRTFYASHERKTPGFWQTDTVHHCGQFTSGQYLHTLTATDVFSHLGRAALPAEQRSQVDFPGFGGDQGIGPAAGFGVPQRQRLGIHQQRHGGLV